MMNEPALAKRLYLLAREIRFWRVGVVVLILALCATPLQGCSFWIADKGRIGPDPDWKFINKPASRQDVERMLGTPIETEHLADGQLRAVYEYTVREGRSVGNQDAKVFMADVMTLFLLEVILVPMAYFQKDLKTYRKEFIYDSNETVTEAFPERLKHDGAERR